MKKYILSSALLIGTAFFIGCGDNGSSVSDQNFQYDTSSIFGFSKNITYKSYSVKAIDDPIVNASVTATNCQTYEEVESEPGTYILEKCIGKPTLIEIKGGKIKDKNVSQDFPLLVNVANTNEDDNFVITPLTTILANANEENITALANKLGVSTDALFSSDNDKVKALFPKINAVLIKSASQGAITNQVKFLNVVRDSVIDNVNNDDFNISKVLDEVKTKSQQNPNLFGLIIIGSNDVNNSDPLETIAKEQNSKTVNFYGLVFDKTVSDANVSVKDLDTNMTYNVTAKSDNNGAWNFKVDENDTTGSLYYTIMNENHLLQFIATKGKIKLTSTISSVDLRNLINESKIVSPSKDNSLIISNVTTAQDAILDKKGALNSNDYEGNLSTLRVYYQDKVIKAAAIVKAVVDNNASTNIDANNTYDLVKKSISDSNNVDINTSTVDANVSEIEQNITNNTILSSQLNDIQVVNGQENKFQTVSKNAGYTFYRLLAYYKENEPKTDANFVREYTKIIVYPGYYYTQTCYLDNNSTADWNCSSSNEINNSSNFTLGQYEVDKQNSIINYSLDFNNSFYVKELNKSYNYYGVIKSDKNLSTGITNTTPMILVDSYDVVDAFRRMPSDEPTDFQQLKNIVSEYNTKKEVNFALNRWIKNNLIDSVGNYFSDSNNQ